MQQETLTLHKQLYELDKAWKEVEKRYRDNRFDHGNPPRTTKIARTLIATIGFTGWWLILFLITKAGGIVLSLSALFLGFRIPVFIPDYSLAKEFEAKEEVYLQERGVLVAQIEA